MSYKKCIEKLVEYKPHIDREEFKLLCEFIEEVHDKEHFQVVNSVNKVLTNGNPSIVYRYGDI